MKVIVIGAGLAGLACAVELADNGYEVEVLEKRPVLGGRVSSWLDKDGDWVETAPHVIRGSYKSLIALMERVGIADRIKWKKQQLVYASKGGKISNISFSPSAGPVEILRSMIGSDLLGFGDKLKLLTGLLPAFTGDKNFIENQDIKNFSDWATNLGVNREAIGRFFDPLSRTVSFLRPDEVSARVIIFQMASIAQGLNATRIGFLDGDPCQRLFQPIQAYLEKRGARIRTNARLARIDFANDEPRALGLELTNGDYLTGDVYVSAMELHALREVLPGQAWSFPFFSRLWQVEEIPVITVQLRFDRQVVTMDNAVFAIGTVMSLVVNLSVTSPGYADDVCLIEMIVAPAKDIFHLDDGEIVRLCLDDLTELFPEVAQANLVKSTVVRIPQALYRCEPGAESRRPTQKTPIENFYLCGDFTHHGYTPSMEGATLSGFRAAQMILETYGRNLQWHGGTPPS
ncbi:MAG: FAD-dependent oxidoreductase [Chloracidobacterium sp.]|uniref:FAD-dependent oxidoreductase n=1 Tax=Chloracidobacterium validum TaxID=2821543 RepID=A0ABX8B8T5_9BACT|nr:FAD-dependent oxidoreductase [Chloracidobacterium validum]QUW02466.1 FAD-dependent oxidoreductase [Chloracidobacterium validum]